MSVNIPLIDISAYPAGGEAAIAALARTVDRACTDIGFLLVSGHGVPDSLIDDMRRVSRRFFARTEAEKLAHRMPPDRYRGYVAMESEALANSLDEPTPPDIKESFNIGPLEGPSDAYRQAATPANFFAENQWPEDEEFQAVWSRYYRSMEDLSFRLMRIFALALGMPERFFDDKIDRHITNFTVLHYPAQERPPQPGQLRAGAHTDYGSLTIVKPDAAPGGLQVRDKAGQWVDVPYVPDAFVVNLGDLMADWTNDRWVSTMHRVINPPTDAQVPTSRISMAFFHQPNYDAAIECLPTCTDPDRPPRHRATTSGEHVWMKITKHRDTDLNSAA